ncbi:MAG: SDR family oxidoreductase [Actinomycetota bacterium]|nr:SDR family oxidoreductase [Actinomycetota bacterium]
MTAERPVVLVTGSRKGIGRHLVEHFIGQGAIVEGCSRQPSDWALPEYTHHCVDVTDEVAVRGMMDSIRQRHGRLDVTINNAGVASLNHCLLTPLDTMRQVMSTNALGTFIVSRESAKLMRRRSFGRIINFSTVAVPMRLEGEAAYVASKSAVVALTRVMAHELAAFGITCNVVGPTPIDTDLIRSVPREKIDDIVSRLAFKRLGQFVDVTNVVDFFVRPESNYVTGQVLYLGGV